MYSSGSGGGGVRPPLLGHDVGFLTLGPKLPPPPFFACRPKMQWRIRGWVGGGQGWSPPLNLSRYWKPMQCAWPGPIPPPLECGWRHTGNVGGGGCLWMSKSEGVSFSLHQVWKKSSSCCSSYGSKCVYIQDGRQAAILNIKNLFDVHNPQTIHDLGLKFQTICPIHVHWEIACPRQVRTDVAQINISPQTWGLIKDLHKRPRAVLPMLCPITDIFMSIMAPTEICPSLISWCRKKPKRARWVRMTLPTEPDNLMPNYTHSPPYRCL